MKVKYDFHIHTALSPCALEEMSPNNIINMAIISNLNAIAISDHNSAKNIESIMKVAKETSILVIPAIEVESKEEIHILCLLPNIENCLIMQEFIYMNLTMLKNKPKVLGEQIVFDDEDEIVGREERLLSFATKLSFESILQKTWELDGIGIPAHIDRPSYSVISNLGIIPENQLLTCLEVSQYANYTEFASKYPSYHLIQSSDAHELGFIGICQQSLDIMLEPDEILTASHIIHHLRQVK